MDNFWEKVSFIWIIADLIRGKSKSLGDKRREISKEQIKQITDIFSNFQETEVSNIFDNLDFGYRKITIEVPLRLNFQASTERLERLKEQTAFINLASSKKKNTEAKKAEEEAGRELQQQILDILNSLQNTVYKDRNEFDKLLKKAFKNESIKSSASLHKAIINALSETDETAEICLNKSGSYEPDTSLRETENVPLKEDINTYFDREVKCHVPLAWISDNVRDNKDREIGKVGYEINFNRYFYKYIPPRELEEIKADIKQIEGEILELLEDVV